MNMLTEVVHSGRMRPSWGGIKKCNVLCNNIIGNQYFIVDIGCSMPKKSFGVIIVVPPNPYGGLGDVLIFGFFFYLGSIQSVKENLHKSPPLQITSDSLIDLMHI